jgi:hypothetical protein
VSWWALAVDGPQESDRRSPDVTMDAAKDTLRGGDAQRPSATFSAMSAFDVDGNVVTYDERPLTTDGFGISWRLDRL